MKNRLVTTAMACVLVDDGAEELTELLLTLGIAKTLSWFKPANAVTLAPL
jgi:hypothetical protein